MFNLQWWTIIDGVLRHSGSASSTNMSFWPHVIFCIFLWFMNTGNRELIQSGLRIQISILKFTMNIDCIFAKTNSTNNDLQLQYFIPVESYDITRWTAIEYPVIDIYRPVYLSYMSLSGLNRWFVSPLQLGFYLKFKACTVNRRKNGLTTLYHIMYVVRKTRDLCRLNLFKYIYSLFKSEKNQKFHGVIKNFAQIFQSLGAPWIKIFRSYATPES